MIQRKDYFTLYDSKNDDSDGIEMEETQYPYYDDNLNLAGYTSKWTERDTGKFFAFIDFNADGSDGSVRECPHCLEYDLHMKLGPKIKKKDEKPAPDDDKFLSCYNCGNTYPIHETFTESKIKDSIQPTDNPFENESIFLTTETRKEQWRKGRKRKGRFSHKDDEDPEIEELLRIYGDNMIVHK